MSKTKELVDQVLQDFEKNKVQTETSLVAMKENIEKLLTDIMKTSRDTIGQIPSEEEFFNVVSEIINRLVLKRYMPALWYRIVMMFGIGKRILKALDKYLLDKYLGGDWYTIARNRALDLLDKKI